MYSKSASTLVAAGASVNLLDGWQWEQPPGPSILEMLMRATAIGMVCTITSGGDTILEESNVQAGGVAGTTPARLNTEPIVGTARGNLRLKVSVRNTTGAGITVDWLANLKPLGMGPGKRKR